MTMPDAQRPLTILIAADTYPPHVNGAAQFGYRLAKGMTGRGHNVHVLACRQDKGKSFTEFRAEGTVHRIRSHSVPTHEYFRITFPWEIKKPANHSPGQHRRGFYLAFKLSSVRSHQRDENQNVGRRRRLRRQTPPRSQRTRKHFLRPWH